MRIKDEKKYQAIIDASIKQFAEDGYAGASISKIAKKAGVSPATIYIHFENKEDLILKLYLHLRREMSEYILDNIDVDACIETEYKKLWMNYYGYCLEKKESFNYIMQFTNSPYMDKYREYGMCYFGDVYDLFKRGKEQGLIKKISDEILFAFTFKPAAQLAKRQDCCGSKLCDAGVENACMVAWDAISDKGIGIECKKMKMKLQDRLVDIFKSGEKEAQMIGVEFEHFLIDETSLRSYHYDEKNGQHDIIKAMVKDGWKVDYEEDGNIFSVEKDGDMISFEPGGQFEISVNAAESLIDIEKAYQKVLNEVEEHLVPGQKLVSLGYHPFSKIDDLPLLPKERYKLMYDYLHQHGFMARNMMKGTASTQVIIDYKSEEDFIKKYRVANFLSPFISRLFDASPVFEGELYHASNLRIRIWENTDICRCKYPLGVLNETFDYQSYAKFIGGIKPIFLPSDGIVPTGDLTLSAYGVENTLTDMQLQHGLSMAFPDVRLKNYIEIRMADALPYPFNMAVPALIKGIFYSQANLEKYYQYSLDYSDQDLIRINDELKNNYQMTFSCQGDSVTCDHFVDEMIQDAISGLNKEEAKYLENFKAFIDENESVANYLKKTYNTPAFVAFLKGDIDVHN